MEPSIEAGDYVLGTSRVEVDRLGLQHEVWKEHARAAWMRAGFAAGHHIIDVGCGPGFATLDLAAVVGEHGRITAIDRSSAFTTALEIQTARRELNHVHIITRDFDNAELPVRDADGAWCRWVFAFVTKPHKLLTEIANAVRPGGKLVLHEYFDYATWRLAPRSKEFETFVATVMRSWRDAGGEPDIALDILGWLADAGFRVLEVRPIVDVVSPSDFSWQWPARFVESGLDRLVTIEYISAEAAAETRRIFQSATANPDVRMVTPAVMEIIAERMER